MPREARRYLDGDSPATYIGGADNDATTMTPQQYHRRDDPRDRVGSKNRVPVDTLSATHYTPTMVATTPSNSMVSPSPAGPAQAYTRNGTFASGRHEDVRQGVSRSGAIARQDSDSFIHSDLRHSDRERERGFSYTDDSEHASRRAGGTAASPLPTTSSKAAIGKEQRFVDSMSPNASLTSLRSADAFSVGRGGTGGSSAVAAAATPSDQLLVRCRMLSSCLEHTTSERDALSEMITSLTTYRDTLLQDIFELRGNNQEMKEALSKLTVEHTQTKDELKRSRERGDGLGEANDKLKESVDTLTQQLDSEMRSSKTWRMDCERLAETVAVLQQKLTDAEHRHAEAQSALHTLKDDHVHLHTESLEARVKQNELEKSVAHKQKAESELLNQVTSLQTTVEDLKGELRVARDRDETTCNAVKTLTSANDELVRENKALRESLQSCAAQRTELEKSIETLRNEETRWKGQHDTIEIIKAGSLATTEQLHAHCDELRERLAAAEARFHIAVDSKTSFQVQEAELRTKLMFTQERCTALESEALRRKVECDSATQQLGEVTATLDAVRGEREHLLEEVASLKQQVTTVTQQLTDSTLECSTFKESRKGLEQQLATSELKHSSDQMSLQHELHLARLECEALRQGSTLSADIQKQLLAIVAFASSQRDATFDQLRQAQQEIKYIQRDLTRAVEDKSALEEQLQRSAKDHSELILRYEQERNALAQTTEALQTTRLDRELLANEIQRSQQLWASMSEEQSVLRKQLRASSIEHNQTPTRRGGGGGDGVSSATSPSNKNVGNRSTSSGRRSHNNNRNHNDASSPNVAGRRTENKSPEES